MRDATETPGLDAVFLFGTCLVDLFFPEAGLAGTRLLRREGPAVNFPQGHRCCGQPAFSCGYHDEARAVAWARMALFPKPTPIVVPSGSCDGTMRHHDPVLFEGEPDRAEAAAGRRGAVPGPVRPSRGGAEGGALLVRGRRAGHGEGRGGREGEPRPLSGRRRRSPASSPSCRRFTSPCST